MIALDGCTDRTAAIVRRYESQGVRLLDFEHRGKSAVLNDAMGELEGEIVLLSDANTDIDSQAARRLARWFTLHDVGAVCGRLVLTDAQTGCNVDSLYWKYETFVKRSEGRLEPCSEPMELSMRFGRNSTSPSRATLSSMTSLSLCLRS